MALTRKFLKAFGIEDEKIDQIIEAHTDTVDALKQERDSYKADAEKLAEVEKKLGEYESSAEKDPWKVKYEAVKEEYDTYKGEQKAKEAHDQKERAYRDLLLETGVGEKYLDKILKVTDIDALELEDGKVKDSEKLGESIAKDWDIFIKSGESKGADIAKPLSTASGPKKMTRSEIMALKDRNERLKAISENMDVFSKSKEQ